MFSPILNTKLFIPPHRIESIPRSRLYESLDGKAGQRIIIINAPAGFGKTTLVVDWLHQQDTAAAWISLDENDNDIHRFFSYLITALQRAEMIHDEVASQCFETLETTPTEILLTGLINHIADKRQDCILILDDYHLIDSPEIHDGLIFLLNHTPYQFRFIIISRILPPLPISKLRAKNQLITLDSDDLRFTRTETEAFLKDAMKLDLSKMEIDQLEAHTEGWVTALQLAALSLKSAPGVTDFLDRISESHQYIAEYLIEEVISNQPDHIQEFLIDTSILKQMCADLCNFMLGIDNSHNILEELQKSNLFITPLDTTSTWYRYHHLFAELLQRNLGSKPGEHLHNLHRTAAEWYLTHEMIEEAIEHLLEAGEYGRVIRNIEHIIDEILAKAKFEVCLQWLNRIPDMYLINNPIVALHQAFFLYEMGEFEKCYQRLAFIEEKLGPEPDTSLSGPETRAMNYGCLNSIKGVIHASQGEIEKAFSHASRALELLPEGPIFWRVLSLTTIAFYRRFMRNYSEAIEKISQALKLASKAGFVFLYYVSISFLSRLQLERGQLFAAIDTCQKALDQDAQADYKIPFTGSTYLLMGELLFLSGDVETAEKHVQRGLKGVRSAGDIFSISRGHYLLARINVALGAPETALLYMDRLRDVIEPLSASTTALKIANAFRAHIQILCNQVDLAKSWAQRSDIDQLEGKALPKILRLPYQGIYRIAQEPLSHHVDFIQYVQARLELVVGNLEKANSIVDRAIKSAERKGRILQTARLLILKSLILENQNQADKAAETFISVFELINPRELIQIFIEEGPPLLVLVRKVNRLLMSKNGRSTQGVDEKILSPLNVILDKLHSEWGKTTNRITGEPHLSTAFELTPRELEVLAWLSKGSTYDEIAAHLYVSKNTIKAHLKHIYSKLEVGNRLQAVNKAKELGLLT